MDSKKIYVMTQEERNLYDAANEYAWNIESGDLNTNRDSFIAGAKWQYEQFEKERLNFEPRLKHCDELTAEQAQIESDFVVQHLKNFNRIPTFIDAIEYGKRLMIDKACEAFCKIDCYGKPPRSTCTSLGTCFRHDNFRKEMAQIVDYLREERNGKSSCRNKR